MKYLFFLIFSLNIIFYIFLIYKPLNIESDFSIEEGNNLNEIFASLEEKNIYFPKAIKLIFNVSGIDKKIYFKVIKDNKANNYLNVLTINKNSNSPYQVFLGLDLITKKKLGVLIAINKKTIKKRNFVRKNPLAESRVSQKEMELHMEFISKMKKNFWY